jgi:hypothetical protein
MRITPARIVTQLRVDLSALTKRTADPVHTLRVHSVISGW